MPTNRNQEEREVRVFGVELRAVGDDPAATPEIVGQAAVYNQLSEVYGISERRSSQASSRT